MRRSIAAIAAVAATLVIAATAAAGTYILFYDHNQNGVADIWLVDDDGNTNTAERMLLDLNENSRAEMQATYDSNGAITGLWLDPEEDGRYEILTQGAYATGGQMIGRYLWYDPGADGLFEIGYYDGNLDGYYESVKVDTNFDGVADTWLANAAPRGQSQTDALARYVSTRVYLDRMTALGFSNFFPSVSVPLP